MTITALPTPPLRSDPTSFASRGDAFLAALPTFAEEANALAAAMNLNSTTDASASGVLIGTGVKTFTVTDGKSFQPGMYLVIADAAAPSANSMWGQITSYSGTSLVVNIIAVRGSGAKTSWVISQSAPGGAAAGENTDITSLAGLTTALSVAQGGTGSTTAATALTALGAAASGANTDITSIIGNAATASAANNGYFTAASSYPKLEIHKPGVMAGQWAINSSGNYVFESTNGAGVTASTLLTLTPSGVLSTSGGYSGNAATASNALGVGQTRQNLTSIRALNTFYTNSTGRTIYILVSVFLSEGDLFTLETSANGSGTNYGQVLFSSTAGFSQYYSVGVLILPGDQYKVYCSSGTLSTWTEIR